jgi:hypothetical protein
VTGSIDADVERLLEPHAPEVAATARALRTTIQGAAPGLVEQVDFGNKLIALGREMSMRGLLFAIVPHSAHVNLQLADGAYLPNADGLIEGTGKRIRHVKVRSVEAAGSPPVRAAIDAQLVARA